MNELAYLIRKDPEVSRVVVIDTPEGRDAVEKLDKMQACGRIELVKEEDARPRATEGLQVFVIVNPSDLHNSQERMRKTLMNEIYKLSFLVDGILMLYGQCRCQTLKVESLQSMFDVPITFLFDRDNIIIDDCIAAALGGRRRYLEMMRRYKGAIFVTPGYVENYARLHVDRGIEHIVTEVEGLKMVMEYLGYRYLLKLDAQLDGFPRYEEMLSVFSKTFDLEVRTLSCNLSVFEDTYEYAKSNLKVRDSDRQIKSCNLVVWS